MIITGMLVGVTIVIFCIAAMWDGPGGALRIWLHNQPYKKETEFNAFDRLRTSLRFSGRAIG